MTLSNRTIRARTATFFLASMLLLGPVLAMAQGELLFFPQAVSSWIDDPDAAVPNEDLHHPGHEERHSEYGVDLFATWERERFRFLAEFLLTNEEQDLERLQVGWRFGRHTLWAGRFHNAIGYWNTVYHHGAYLQTSISRPAIVDYEEHGGVIPMHQAGIEWEGSVGNPAYGVGYSLSVGAGPWFNGEELHIWNVLDSSEGDHDFSGTFSVDREWEWGRAGLFGNFNRIPTALAEIPEIEQWVAGAFFQRGLERLQMQGAALHVSNRLEYSTDSEKYRFGSAFLQLEFEVTGEVTLYARGEASFGDDGDAYLALFPHFVRQRLLGGLRWDLFDCSALKLELSTNRIEESRYGQLMLQWSAQL